MDVFPYGHTSNVQTFVLQIELNLFGGVHLLSTWVFAKSRETLLGLPGKKLTTRVTGSAFLLSPSLLLLFSNHPFLCVTFHRPFFHRSFSPSVPRPPCPCAGETTVVKASHGAWPSNWETYHGPIQSLQEVRGHRLLQCPARLFHRSLDLHVCALVEILIKA